MLDKNCSACGLKNRSGCKSPALKPNGAEKPKYIIVGGQPTKSDDEAGALFGSRTSSRFKTVLSEVGFNLEEVMFTAAVRCKPESKAQESEIRLCGETVRMLIELHEPDSIIMMGETALRAVFPNAYDLVYTISRTRGMKIPYITKSGKVVTCIATYDANFIFQGKDENVEQAWYDDLASALDPLVFKLDMKPNIILCKTFEQVKECSARLRTEKSVAFDFETTQLKPYGQSGKVSELYSVAYAFEDGTSYAMPLFNYWPTNMQKAIMDMVGNFFYDLNPTQVKIAHNTKFDMQWGMYKAGKGLERAPQGQWEDTSLLCAMNDERPGMSSLKTCAFRYLGANNWSVDVTNVRSLPLDDVLRYNALDSFYTMRLYQWLKPLLCSDEKGDRLYREFLIPAMLQFLKVEMRGVQVDEVARGAFYKLYNEKLTQYAREVVELANRPALNPGSDKQLREYFLNVKKYKLSHKTSSGQWSVDKDAMKHLVDTYNCPVASKILDYRGVAKLQSTYISGLSKNIYLDGKLHGGFNLTAAVTGRTSSNEPNMQNFPKRKNREVRGIVIPPAGHKICSFDYGQIEARLFAVITGDEAYLNDLRNGYDIHMEKALWLYRDMLGWDEADARKERGNVKASVFAAFYGAGDYTIAQSLGIPQDLAREFRESIFKRYPRVKEWQRELVAHEAEYGFAESLFGRKRRSPVKYNELLNFPMQSTASDMTLTAMNFLGRKYDIAFMIHDDLSMFLKNDEYLPDHIAYIADAMLTLPWLFLSKSPQVRSYAPLSVECEVGDNWAEQTAILNLDSMEAGYPTMESCLARAEIVRDELMSVGW